MAKSKAKKDLTKREYVVGCAMQVAKIATGEQADTAKKPRATSVGSGPFDVVIYYPYVQYSSFFFFL